MSNGIFEENENFLIERTKLQVYCTKYCVRVLFTEIDHSFGVFLKKNLNASL